MADWEMPGTSTAPWIWHDTREDPHGSNLSHTWGKWMTFHPPCEIDDAWTKAKQLIDLGDVGSCKFAKVSTVAYLRNSACVIIWYSPDDLACVATGEQIVEGMEYLKRCYYKTDNQTRSGVYSGRGRGAAHTRSVPGFSEKRK